MYIYTHTHTFILMYIHVYPLCTVSDTDFTFIGVIQFPFLYTKQMSWLKENIKLKTNCTWIQPKSWQRIENNQVSPTQCCFRNSQVLVRCADAQPPRPEWKARRKTHKSLGNFLHAEVWEPLRHSTWTIFFSHLFFTVLFARVWLFVHSISGPHDAVYFRLWSSDKKPISLPGLAWDPR